MLEFSICFSIKVNVIRSPRLSGIDTFDVYIVVAAHSTNTLIVSDAWVETHFNCAHLAEKSGLKTLFVHFGNLPAFGLNSIPLYTDILLALNVTLQNTSFSKTRTMRAIVRLSVLSISYILSFKLTRVTLDFSFKFSSHRQAFR